MATNVETSQKLFQWNLLKNLTFNKGSFIYDVCKKNRKFGTHSAPIHNNPKLILISSPWKYLISIYTPSWKQCFPIFLKNFNVMKQLFYLLIHTIFTVFISIQYNKNGKKKKRCYPSQLSSMFVLIPVPPTIRKLQNKYKRSFRMAVM